ncbi:hypothetical protein GW17_00004532 [Ensete ventricosum]|nr:hypothetical protein GW17_00004532 [Ensete ventricosum]
MRFLVCARSPPWSSDVVALLLSSGSFLGQSTTSWSYVGHVVATVPDKSPTTRCQGHCSLVGYCVSPDTPSVANCRGSGDTVRWSITALALTHRWSPTVMGQGALVEGRSGMSALLRRSLWGEDN